MCFPPYSGSGSGRGYFLLLSQRDPRWWQKGHTNIPAEQFPPQLQRITSRQMREIKPRPNKVRITQTNSSAESNQHNPQIWNQSPELILWTPRVDLSGLDQCGEDKGNPTRYIRAVRGERPIMMMHFWNMHNILPDPYVILRDESKRVQEARLWLACF